MVDFYCVCNLVEKKFGDSVVFSYRKDVYKLVFFCSVS